MRRQYLFLLMMLWAGFAVATERTPTPEFYVSEGGYEYVVEVFGEGEIHLFKDGVEVENPCTIELSDEDQYYHFEAYAQLEGYLPSEWISCDVYVPHEEWPLPPVLPDMGLNITLAEEYILLNPYINDNDYSVEYVLVDGIMLDYPYMLPRYNYEYRVDVVVVFSAEGYNDYDYHEELLVPAMEGDCHDVDFNGKVNIDDLTALIHYLLSNDSQGISLGKADCDANGWINIDDVAELINYLLNM